MIHIQRSTDDFKGNDNRQKLSSQTPSYLEVNRKILSGISEDKSGQQQVLLKIAFCEILTDYVTMSFRNGTQ